MRVEGQRVIIEDYGRRPTFSSFLPGIAGTRGIPIWCHYVNRGQAVASFGVEDKDHSIMEFCPAHQAYQNVKRTGFRTFIRRDRDRWEPFAREAEGQRMEISMNTLTLVETRRDWGLETRVDYFVLPGEKVGALVRKLTVTNISGEEWSCEILDGMPALVPYGVNLWTLKYMCQTGKAWMEAEDAQTGVPCFCVRASMEDTAQISEVKGGHFSLGTDGSGKLLEPVVDPEAVFGYDTSLEEPVVFWEGGLAGILTGRQSRQNLFPCSFYGVSRCLAAGESAELYQLIGQVADREQLEELRRASFTAAWFADKYREAERLTQELTAPAAVRTADPVFDAYCRYTYLDNGLRGGFPVLLPGKKIFYTYSRKHGDLERDYNYFTLRPEYYSQGNGNYRDMNQNRRCDVSFAPFVGDYNIRLFYDLIQLDGCNPLQLDPVTFCLSSSQAEEYGVPESFTPGELCRILWTKEQNEEKQKELFAQIMEKARLEERAVFGEGYWCDHWTYGLDLVEDYLSIFPDKEEELLFTENLRWYKAKACLKPCQKRSKKTAAGLRQYEFLDERETDGDWEAFSSSLLEKFVLLCSVKFAALDFYAMGISMEGGKPGWYDALNGLPGLYGSSMAETCELERLLHFTIEKLCKYGRSVRLRRELHGLLKELGDIADKRRETLKRKEAQLPFYLEINRAAEAYRTAAYAGQYGESVLAETGELAVLLEPLLSVVTVAVEKAQEDEQVFPTYYYYEITRWKENETGIWPLEVKQKKAPLFLEGSVHWLRSGSGREEKLKLYRAVKESSLYDKELKMYKVNASLREAGIELGRAAAFTPGWLENESIWLHMEYKYLLELLRSGLYEEFTEDFRQAAIPFLDADRYGRSPLENSSFLVSSSNPDERLWGRGFVARLSGSTAEFLTMWKWMFFGQKPFETLDGELVFRLTPALPAFLVGDRSAVEARFLGQTDVVYRLTRNTMTEASFMPGEYEVGDIQLLYTDGSIRHTRGLIRGEKAIDVREGRVRRIEAELHLLSE